MSIEILCPLCEVSQDEENKTIAFVHFTNATEYANHILAEHADDKRAIWAKSHLDYIAQQKALAEEAAKENLHVTLKPLEGTQPEVKKPPVKAKTNKKSFKEYLKYIFWSRL